MKSPFNANDLVRLFQFNGYVPYIHSDDFVNGYKDLDGIAMGNQSFWISYMPKQAEISTRKEGLDIYSDKEKYDQLKQDQDTIFQKVNKLKNKIVKSKIIKREDIGSFLQVITEYGICYRFTESFYTDLAFEKKEKYPTIVENFKTFEELKLKGRQKLNEIFFVPGSMVEVVLLKTAQYLKMASDAIFQYSRQEIMEAFEGKRVNNQKIKERWKAYVIFSKNNEIKEIIGDEAAKIISNLYKSTHSSKELKGQTASKGKAKGIAKVIKVSISDYGKLSEIIDSMHKGQILIAETTEPAIIQACKKAIAIVTNQGGMMSHAAIISRELKIPCIVGTGNATEIIKDGDMVEVDANKGIVRVLK